jgi:hypothetical protein
MERFSQSPHINLIKQLIMLGFFLGIVSCQTTVVLTSDPPGTNVFDGDKLLGVTPLEINVKDLKEEKADGYLLGMQQSGYYRVMVWIPGWIDDLDVSINMKPFIVSEQGGNRPTESSASRRLVYANTAELFKIQNRVLSDQDVSPEVIAELDKQIKDNPNLGSLAFLKAVVLARQNKDDEAKILLTRAMQLSPREYDFLSMYNILGGVDSTGKSDEAAKPAEDSQKP